VSVISSVRGVDSTRAASRRCNPLIAAVLLECRNRSGGGQAERRIRSVDAWPMHLAAEGSMDHVVAGPEAAVGRLHFLILMT